jgi:hypothetical protein
VTAKLIKVKLTLEYENVMMKGQILSLCLICIFIDILLLFYMSVVLLLSLQLKFVPIYNILGNGLTFLFTVQYYFLATCKFLHMTPTCRASSGLTPNN